MFIVAGQKQVRKAAGLAADYCPVCRDFRAFDVTIVRQVAHLYYVPMGAGTILAHELECVACRSLFGVLDPGHTGYSKTHVADLAELARVTNPDLMSRHRGDLVRLERLAEGTLSGRERRDMIREPFEALDYMVQKRWGKGSIPALGGFALVVSLVLIGTSVALWSAGNGQRGVAAVMTALAAIAGVAAIISLSRGPRKWVRTHIHPRLAAALIPLEPTADELERVLQDMRRAKRVIGRRVRGGELAADLARWRGRSTAPTNPR